MIKQPMITEIMVDFRKKIVVYFLVARKRIINITILEINVVMAALTTEHRVLFRLQHILILPEIPIPATGSAVRPCITYASPYKTIFALSTTVFHRLVVFYGESDYIRHSDPGFPPVQMACFFSGKERNNVNSSAF